MATFWEQTAKTKTPYVVPTTTNPYQQPTPGQNFANYYYNRKANAGQLQNANKIKQSTDVAADVANKSAGTIPVDQYGIVKDTQAASPLDLISSFNQQNSAITKAGTLAADTEVAKNQWQQLKRSQDLGASYNVNLNGLDYSNSPVSSDNPGGKAVALALQAFKNGTPYVWGGNSLTQGIDCSGLAQQVYAQLGYKIPRTTYEQAKSGKIVNLSSLMPGDLVFYNTGSSDPNGIGQYSHVAIYAGNGQIIDARNTKSGMKNGSIYDPGTPVLGVRPW